MTVKNTTKETTLAALILLAAFSRLIPHAPNFTAVGAMALFAGATLGSRTLAVFVPLAALFLSDLVLGLHNTMFFTYGTFALIALLAHGFLRQNSAGKTVGMSLFASILFFLTTNFGVWLAGGMYAKDLSGLVTCYTMALPFLANQILGDLFYSGVLFGAWALMRNYGPQALRAN